MPFVESWTTAPPRNVGRTAVTTPRMETGSCLFAKSGGSALMSATVAIAGIPFAVEAVSDADGFGVAPSLTGFAELPSDAGRAARTSFQLETSNVPGTLEPSSA